MSELQHPSITYNLYFHHGSEDDRNLIKNLFEKAGIALADSWCGFEEHGELIDIFKVVATTNELRLFEGLYFEATSTPNAYITYTRNELLY